MPMTAAGHSFTYNGVDFSNPTTHNLAVVKTEYNYGAPIRNRGVSIPMRPGLIAGEGQIGPLIIRLNCVVESTTLALLKTQLEEIAEDLSVDRIPGAEDKVLLLDTEDVTASRLLFINARVNGQMRKRWIGTFAAGLEIEFIANDPHWFLNSGQTTNNFVHSTNTQSHTAGLTIDMDWVYPIIEVFPQNVGTISSTFIIENEDTGEAIQNTANFTVDGGDIDTDGFRINGPTRTWEVTANGGATWTPSMANVSGTFPRISKDSPTLKCTLGGNHPSNDYVFFKFHERRIIL